MKNKLSKSRNLLAVLACGLATQLINAASSSDSSPTPTVVSKLPKLSFRTDLRLSAAMPGKDVMLLLMGGTKIEFLLNGQSVGSLTAASLTPENMTQKRLPINDKISFEGVKDSQIKFTYTLVDPAGTKTAEMPIVLFDETGNRMLGTSIDFIWDSKYIAATRVRVIQNKDGKIMVEGVTRKESLPADKLAEIERSKQFKTQKYEEMSRLFSPMDQDTPYAQLQERANAYTKKLQEIEDFPESEFQAKMNEQITKFQDSWLVGVTRYLIGIGKPFNRSYDFENERDPLYVELHTQLKAVPGSSLDMVVNGMKRIKQTRDEKSYMYLLKSIILNIPADKLAEFLEYIK